MHMAEGSLSLGARSGWWHQFCPIKKRSQILYMMYIYMCMYIFIYIVLRILTFSYHRWGGENLSHLPLGSFLRGFTRHYRGATVDHPKEQESLKDWKPPATKKVTFYMGLSENVVCLNPMVNDQFFF